MYVLWGTTCIVDIYFRNGQGNNCFLQTRWREAPLSEVCYSKTELEKIFWDLKNKPFSTHGCPTRKCVIQHKYDLSKIKNMVSNAKNVLSNVITCYPIKECVIQCKTILANVKTC